MPHAPPRVLYKTTIVIWSDRPSHYLPPGRTAQFFFALYDLVKQFQQDLVYVARMTQVPMNPHEVVQDPEWDNNEFFDKETTDDDKKPSG